MNAASYEWVRKMPNSYALMHSIPPGPKNDNWSWWDNCNSKEDDLRLQFEAYAILTTGAWTQTYSRCARTEYFVPRVKWQNAQTEHFDNGVETRGIEYRGVETRGIEYPWSRNWRNRIPMESTLEESNTDRVDPQ